MRPLLRAVSRVNTSTFYPTNVALHKTHSLGPRASISIPTIFSRPLSQSITTHNAKPQPPSHNSKPTLKSQPNPNDNSAAPSMNLFAMIKELKGPARWVIYTGLAILATAETTFWSQVVYAKFFSKDEQKADELLGRVKEAVREYRRVWLPNYRKYYSDNIWGL